MKKIEKTNPKAAQSVFSFACPCLGSCSTTCGCSCTYDSNQMQGISVNNGSYSKSFTSVPGAQTVNYN
mgnify:FL=1